MEYIVDIIEDSESLKAIADEWKLFYMECRSKNVFLNHAWISSWSENSIEIKNLFVIIIRNKQKRIVGIAPLAIFNRKRLQLKFRTISFIGDGPSDYQDFLTLENNNEVVNEIVSTIERNKNKWDVVELVNIPYNSSNVESILNNQKLHFRQRTCAICPKIEYNDTNSSIDGIISKKYKQDVLYQIRKLEKIGTVELLKINDKEQIQGFMSSFYNLHKKKWNMTETKSCFNSSDFQRFFTTLSIKMFDEGMASLSYLNFNDKMIACHFGFRYKGTFYYYFPAYDPVYSKYSIGKVFLYQLIKSEVDTDLKNFDFLRGGEEYKKHWGTKDYNNIQLTSVKTNLKGFITLFQWYYNSNRQLFVFKLYRKLSKLFSK